MDFSSLVLVPCQEIFSKPITITPVASIPNASTYAARGIWTVKTVDLILEDGGKLTSRTIEMDVRVLELPAIPQQDDVITLTADDQFLPFGISSGASVNLIVDDTRLDSGGACKLILKRVM